MQHITLVKTLPTSADLSHVYEHLYYDALLQFMAEHNLISRLDYYITAKTYRPGLIYFDIELYTSQAQSIAAQLGQQKISLEDAAVAVALLQIMAENKHALRGEINIFEVLSELDRKSWINLEQVDLIDLREHKQSNELPVYTKAELKTQNLKVSLKLRPASRRDLTPLFAAISHILIANLENSLMDTYGYYAFEESTEPNKFTSFLRASQEHRPILTDELDTCKEAITQMLRMRLVERLTQTLSTIPGEGSLPDELEIYNATHILVGKKGWQSLATENNIQSVLQNMTLELSFGKEKQHMQLADITELAVKA